MKKTNLKKNPFYSAIKNSNVKVVDILLKYVNKHNIILEINKKIENGSYPLYWPIDKNNTIIVKRLMNYANENNIILAVNEKK